MVGDNINIKEEYFATARAVVDLMKERGLLSSGRCVVGIGGESGSGKSVTAICLQSVLNKMEGLGAAVLHQDDYFRLPPETNHFQRLSDISKVGLGEVNLEMMQQHIALFKSGAKHITKPLVNYGLNEVHSETIDTSSASILLVEGTYSLTLEHLDFKVFMDRTYHETYAQRLARGREKADPFIERVLDIEHQIIRPTRVSADVVVNKLYQVELNKHDQ